MMKDHHFEALKDYCQAIELLRIKLDKIYESETGAHFQICGPRKKPVPVHHLETLIDMSFAEEEV